MYYKSTNNVSPWIPDLCAESKWIESERLWILMHAGPFKAAVCGVYLKVNAPTNHEHNKKLLDQISKEMHELESLGYMVAIMGDCNAHIEKSNAFRFENYPHPQNFNGKLLETFAASNSLLCLNPLTWNGRKEERLTYQRSFGARRHGSILDYVLASRLFMPSISEMKVVDNERLSVTSDHATLLIKYARLIPERGAKAAPVNIYRSIKKWQSYKKILESRMKSVQQSFNKLSIQQQNNELENHMKAAGRSCLSSVKEVVHRRRKTDPRLKRAIIMSRRARRAWRSAAVDGETEHKIRKLESIWRKRQSLARSLDLKLEWRRKLHQRLKLAKKGATNSRFFWRFVSNKQKSNSHIDALETSQGLVFASDRKTEEIESFLKAKFNASENPIEVDDHVNDSALGQPPVKLSSSTSRKVIKRITINELNVVLDKLDVTKAEGEDGITTAMIKNTGELARQSILTFLNNVLIGGVNPTEWKVGKVVLVLKRQPSTDAKNYWPITLISVLSKVLSGIMAQRVAEAVEESGICGDNQNGFRKGRSCADNIFILNGLLDINRHNKWKSNLLFLDFAEAYDRVDRSILFKKLRQLNFPEAFVRYLEEYYKNDFIVTTSAGMRSRNLYLTRGLRQGCPMSAILFAIYISELGWRLERTDLGMKLQDEEGTTISNLFFADDGILLANRAEDLDDLKSIVEGYCFDFRMKISPGYLNL